MSRRVLLAILALVLALGGAPKAHAQTEPPDSLGAFFKGLSDSTDASYGEQSVAFDTTGLDSLAENALLHPPVIKRRGGGLLLAPLLGYHRTEGALAGLALRVGAPAAGWLTLSGTYGFGNEQGRYSFGYRRTLLYRGLRRQSTLRDRGRILDHATRLDLDLEYARSSAAFMPEHAPIRLWNIEPVISGQGSASFYQQRGAIASLTFWTGDWRLLAGVRHANEEPMSNVSDWTLFGSDEPLPVNRVAQYDEYTEPFGSLGFWRGDWELAGLVDARGGGADRWRLRGVLAKALRLGNSLKLYAQFEGGATAANAPPQRQFELGGDKAVPSLDIDTGGNDHLLLGKFEFIEAHDILRAIHLPHPDWLVLQPLVIFHSGTAWNDAAGRDVVFSTPPSESWRSSAGAGLAWRIGVPDPDVALKMYLAWPMGPEAGRTQLRITLGTTFDLLGRL